MPRQLLIEYLDRQRANYSCHTHPVAYTALGVAASGHINSDNFAKVVMIKVDAELAMMVIPAHYQLPFELMPTLLSANTVELATEREFRHRFPRCELGAMPPFGHLFGLQTYMVPIFIPGQEIAFNAGTHSELICMPLREYQRLAYAIDVGEEMIPPPSLLFKMAARQTQILR